MHRRTTNKNRQRRRSGLLSRIIFVTGVFQHHEQRSVAWNGWKIRARSTFQTRRAIDCLQNLGANGKKMPSLWMLDSKKLLNSDMIPDLNVRSPWLVPGDYGVLVVSRHTPRWLILPTKAIAIFIQRSPINDSINNSSQGSSWHHHTFNTIDTRFRIFEPVSTCLAISCARVVTCIIDACVCLHVRRARDWRTRFKQPIGTKHTSLYSYIYAWAVAMRRNTLPGRTTGSRSLWGDFRLFKKLGNRRKMAWRMHETWKDTDANRYCGPCSRGMGYNSAGRSLLPSCSWLLCPFPLCLSARVFVVFI